MCPKKLEFDSREKKTPLIHRFMTPKAPPEEPKPSAEEKIFPADISDNNGSEKSPEIISVDPVEVIPLSAYEAPPVESADAYVETVDVEEDIVPESVSIPGKEEAALIPDILAPAVKAEENVPADEKFSAADYKKFMTSAQENIDGIKNAQEDIKAQLKASLKAELIEELRKELKNELLEEIAPKEIPKDKVELKIVRQPVENIEPVTNASKPAVEKTIETRYMFRNTMEDIVAEEVAGILKNEKKMCKCSRCVNDICAIVLNSLTPHYVTSEVAQLYDRAGLLDITKSNKLTVNIFKAIEHVKNKPSHEV